MTTPTKQPRIELAPWQFEIGGFVFGHGTHIPIGNIEGLGSPATRPQDVDNPTGEGTFPGQDFYGTRTLRFEASIKTPGDPAKAADLLARLELALDDPDARTRPEGRHVLRGRWPGHRTRRMYGRLRRAEATSATTAINGWIPLDLEFAGTDPRWYDDELSQLSLGLDQEARSKGRDRTVDQTLCAPESRDHADPNDRPGWISNQGNVSSWPSIRIHGPVANPRIWNTVTGRVLELRLALRAGEWVELETRPRTRWALRNGKVNVANDLTPPSRLDLFALPRGRSEIGWSGDDPTGTARLEVSWRSAYTAL
ncbi:hypothetical protein M2271_002225 [Streptomyces sp. LBL]|uniref:phage tail domain-containing protein n=1 Tax=Streptomyces sp. LBL TaxID=2940562 RepID=UPI002472F75C|nr:phage tail domain-containing protein [Streptomyces sp. LBL]MDH6624423.1 hypothetical protein [Streptomyces sp. LBL]